jgi:type I site-specific restriction endonuclease
MPAPNKTNQIASLQSLCDGLTKHASDIPSLVLGSATVQNADIVGKIQGAITLVKASAAARVAFQEAVASERAAIAALQQLLDDLKQTLRARFSNSPTTLADFGLKARTRTKPSPTTQVAAAAKAKSTRKARGTKGAKQAAAVQGNVTGVVVTPVVEAPAAPAPEPAAAATPAPVAPKS